MASLRSPTKPRGSMRSARGLEGVDRTGVYFAHWYGGAAAEVPVDTVSMDVRQGGVWRATMFAGGQEIHWRGEYHEVIEPERLVFTVTDQPGDVYDLITVVLTDLGEGRTEMLMEQSGGHMTPEEYGEAEKGWGVFFDRMAERLAGSSRRARGWGEHAPAGGEIDELAHVGGDDLPALARVVHPLAVVLQ